MAKTNPKPPVNIFAQVDDDTHRALVILAASVNHDRKDIYSAALAWCATSPEFKRWIMAGAIPPGGYDHASQP